MTAYAEHQFDLSLTKIGEGTKRDHLLQVERQTGKRPQELDGPICPHELLYLWSWWSELHQGSPPEGITYTDLLAWGTLYQIHFQSFELSAIMHLDRAFRMFANKEQERRRPKGV